MKVAERLKNLPSGLCGLVALALGLLLISCAPAVAPDQELINPFIPKIELVSVSIVREGMSFYNRSRFLDAEFSFRQAIYLNPELDNLKLNLAVTLQREGQFDEAEEIYKALLVRHPDEHKYLMGLAKLYYSKSDYTSAAKYYQRAADKGFDDSNYGRSVKALRSMAVMNFKIGDEQEALCNSTQIIALVGDNQEYLKNLKLLVAMNRFPEVISSIESSAFDRGIERDPNFVHLKALASFGIGRFKEAYEFEEQTYLLTGINPSLKNEIELVRSIVEQDLIASGEITPKQDRDQDLVQEKFEDLLERLNTLSDVALLYWPPNLVERFKSELKRLEIDQDN